MVQFNLLTESFISNSGIVDQYPLTSLEMDNLIAESGNILTFSGQNISLLLDLGYQKDTDILRYTFTPTSLSGLSIRYGRNLDDLYLSTPSLVGDSIEVSPTQSGYTYPRYWLVTHSATLAVPITLSGLTILNADATVDFGVSGTINSVVITPLDGVEGYSEAEEVSVYNDGSIPTDIYVSVDTYNLDNAIFDKIEVSTSSTGTFKSINEELSMPSGVPWEWGDFSNQVTLFEDDNSIRLYDSSVQTIPLIIGSGTVFTSIDRSSYSNNMIAITNSLGEDSFAFTDDGGRVNIVNARKGTVFIGSNPPTVFTTLDERQGHGIAWDGDDRIYYMINSTDQTIRYYKISTNTHHILTTVSFYARATRFLIYIAGSLYIAGVRGTAGTSSSTGTDFYEVNVSTLVGTVKTSLPQTPSPTTARWGYLNGYIYFTLTGSTNFWRYNVALDSWEGLSSLPASAVATQGILPNTNTSRVYVVVGTFTKEMYEYNPISDVFTGPVFSGLVPTGLDSCTLGASNSILFCKDDSSPRYYSLMAISDVPDPILPVSFSGTWLSPIFKLDNSENYHKVMIEYDSNFTSYLKADSSIGVDNFEFRGSNSSPSSDNFIEDFNEFDSDAFLSESLSEFSLSTISGGYLIFSHDYQNPTETPYNRSYLYFSLPLNSAGKMQYRFWWNPSIKTVGAENFSRFYIVPYLNTIGQGNVPNRDPDTLDRVDDDYIYLRFGNATDTNGSYTSIGVYNGSSTTFYGINAVSGKFYEISFILNWETGDYTLYFAGVQVGTGTIPMIQLVKLESQHAYEFFSTSDGVDSQERFKRLTISRIGTVAVDDENIAIPVHIQDPLFGRNGSLPWFPVTVNSGLIPKYKYVQLRLTFRSDGVVKEPKITGVKFPVVLKLEQVPVGGYKSFYVRYNFPVSNSISTTTAYIKAWMATDKT